MASCTRDEDKSKRKGASATFWAAQRASKTYLTSGVGPDQKMCQSRAKTNAMAIGMTTLQVRSHLGRDSEQVAAPAKSVYRDHKMLLCLLASRSPLRWQMTRTTSKKVKLIWTRSLDCSNVHSIDTLGSRRAKSRLSHCSVCEYSSTAPLVERVHGVLYCAGPAVPRVGCSASDARKLNSPWFPTLRLSRPREERKNQV